MDQIKINNITLDDEVLANRKVMFSEIKDNVDILDFIKKYNLDLDYVFDNIQKFYDWINELKLVKKCHNSDVCYVENDGYYFDLVYDGGYLSKVLKPCPHQIEYNKKMSFIKNYIVKDFPNSLIEVDIASILSKKEPENYMHAVAHVMKFLDNPVGSGFYFYGDVGVGKTYLLSALTNELAKLDKKIAFVELGALANDLKNKMSEYQSLDKILYDLKNVEILVLDDIGSENVTNWFRDDILFTILNYRMEALKTTFFTSNLSIDELQEYYSVNNRREVDDLAAKRLIERIKALSIPVKMSGTNRRVNINELL